jgi:hypothetical protein
VGPTSGSLQAHDFVWVPRPLRLPAVLTREEASGLFAGMNGTHRWMAQLLYGTALRLLHGGGQRLGSK